MKVENSYPNPNGYKVKVLDAERSWGESWLLHAFRRVTATSHHSEHCFLHLGFQEERQVISQSKEKGPWLRQ